MIPLAEPVQDKFGRQLNEVKVKKGDIITVTICTTGELELDNIRDELHSESERSDRLNRRFEPSLIFLLL